jgi:hypothetical protein
MDAKPSRLILRVGMLLAFSSVCTLGQTQPFLDKTITAQAQIDPTSVPLSLFLLGDGTIEGIHGTRKLYKDHNGESVWMILLHCKSVDEAKHVYDARINKSLAVVKRERIADSSEHPAVQTVVLNVAGKRDKRVETEIVIMFGSEVRIVDSYVTSDALALAALLGPKP